MKVLFLGDIVGRSGRSAVAAHLPSLKAELGIDFTVVNGENLAAGFGLTQATCEEMFAAGVDVITTGNHVWDQRDIVPVISSDSRILRPLNFPAGTPGRGACHLCGKEPGCNPHHRREFAHHRSGRPGAGQA
ncbi:YmdB family metallophosphoesterase, partial [Anaerolineae bacterium CFX9]|nr:YmdB family metallophosphoesterase [Anaerolineae bacterium CFX9]